MEEKGRNFWLYYVKQRYNQKSFNENIINVFTPVLHWMLGTIQCYDSVDDSLTQT